MQPIDVIEKDKKGEPPPVVEGVGPFEEFSIAIAFAALRSVANRTPMDMSDSTLLAMAASGHIDLVPRDEMEGFKNSLQSLPAVREELVKAGKALEDITKEYKAYHDDALRNASDKDETGSELQKVRNQIAEAEMVEALNAYNSYRESGVLIPLSDHERKALAHREEVLSAKVEELKKPVLDALPAYRECVERLTETQIREQDLKRKEADLRSLAASLASYIETPVGLVRANRQGNELKERLEGRVEYEATRPLGEYISFDELRKRVMSEREALLKEVYGAVKNDSDLYYYNRPKIAAWSLTTNFPPDVGIARFKALLPIAGKICSAYHETEALAMSLASRPGEVSAIEKSVTAAYEYLRGRSGFGYRYDEMSLTLSGSSVGFELELQRTKEIREKVAASGLSNQQYDYIGANLARRPGDTAELTARYNAFFAALKNELGNYRSTALAALAVLDSELEPAHLAAGAKTMHKAISRSGYFDSDLIFPAALLATIPGTVLSKAEVFKDAVERLKAFNYYEDMSRFALGFARPILEEFFREAQQNKVAKLESEVADIQNRLPEMQAEEGAEAYQRMSEALGRIAESFESAAGVKHLGMDLDGLFSASDDCFNYNEKTLKAEAIERKRQEDERRREEERREEEERRRRREDEDRRRRNNRWW